MPPSRTPRLFIVRHGETEWSLSGRHTGVSDIPLTEHGERRIRATGKALVGHDRLIVPENLAAVWVSPRVRAQRTLELLFEEGIGGKSGKDAVREGKEKGWVETREDIREWDYGRYEGWLTKEIQAEREKEGKGKWLIWRDGCPDGENSEQVTARLDKLIAELRERFHAPACTRIHSGTEKHECPPSDVLVVAHGHILRALVARWIGASISQNPNLILEAGGVGTLSYEHNRIDEPAILLGGAFVVDD